MQLTAKLIQLLPIQTGTGKNGEWEKQDIIVETINQYPKNVCISIWNGKVDVRELEVGKEYIFHCNIESKEYNSRWYTAVTLWKIDNIEKNDLIEGHSNTSNLAKARDFKELNVVHAFYSQTHVSEVEYISPNDTNIEFGNRVYTWYSLDQKLMNIKDIKERWQGAYEIVLGTYNKEGKVGMESRENYLGMLAFILKDEDMALRISFIKVGILYEGEIKQREDIQNDGIKNVTETNSTKSKLNQEENDNSSNFRGLDPQKRLSDSIRDELLKEMKSEDFPQDPDFIL